MDEEYVMFLADYISSIEDYDGEFTRSRAQATFNYNDKLEDRMINSIKIDAEKGVYFEVESNRVNRVICKICCGLLYEEYGTMIDIVKSAFLPISQMSVFQINEMKDLNWKVVQAQRFQFAIDAPHIHLLINNALYCISLFEEH